jgi:hypothetical protein
MKCLVIAKIEIKIQIELNAMSVGSSFFILTQISRDDVTPLIIKNHQICTPKIKPGNIIIALANHAATSTLLYSGSQ